jgi:hypothetical protein
MTPRQRLHEAFLDVVTEMPPDLIDRVANTLEGLLGHHRRAAAARAQPKPIIVGNVVALPGVDLDAARRAQRRSRGRARP